MDIRQHLFIRRMPKLVNDDLIKLWIGSFSLKQGVDSIIKGDLDFDLCVLFSHRVNALFHHSTEPELSVGLPSQKSF